MTAHDTTRARAVMEARMTDEVLIERDPQGPRDDTYDPDTLEVIHPHGDLTTVYTGPAIISPAGRDRGRTVDIGGVEHFIRGYSVSIPAVGAAEVGDLVTVTASADPNLTGRQLRVTDVEMRTIRARTRLVCEFVRPAPRA